MICRKGIGSLRVEYVLRINYQGTISKRKLVLQEIGTPFSIRLSYFSSEMELAILKRKIMNKMLGVWRLSHCKQKGDSGKVGHVLKA